MILKSIELNNIRSYRKAHIKFPNGSVLLSGDIGAGKSSILSAIEFALFGIKRGEISGSSLLRHGQKEGFVILNIEVSGKDIIIKRTLKKSKYGVKQESGFIAIDGMKSEATAEELKARVLEILGYPKDLLKKGKDLVYRFTVYTPQEQMKAILMERKEERLDTLRKVFGIDKYKKIRENASLYITELRSRKRTLQGKVYGLEDKIKAREEKVSDGESIKKNIESLMPKLEKKNEEVKNFKLGMEETEKKITEINNLKNSIKVIETQLMDKFLLRRKTKEKLDDIQRQIKDIEKTGINNDSKENYSEKINEEINEKVKEKRKALRDYEDKYNKVNKEIGEIESYMKSSQKVIEKIKNIDKCPTCEQEVNDKHKEDIAERENGSIKIHQKKKDELEEELKKISEIIKNTNSEIEELVKSERKIAIEKEKLKNYYEKKELLTNYDNDLNALKKEIASLNSQKIEKTRQLSSFGDIEVKYKEDKAKLELILGEQRKIDNHLTREKAYLDENKKLIELYDREIKEKNEFKEQIKKTTQIQNWLEEQFISLMNVIEKNVMGQLYKEFNEMFVEWFRMLIEDETLNVRLDDQFTPIIEQNGFETDVSYLSGGEKTSVALAYRLALNKVINDFITHMKTRDVIILDEPTDGFSDEQLDNVRDVLEQLNVKQAIIVSHESKIESFVDNVIRVSKTQNKSVVH